MYKLLSFIMYNVLYDDVHSCIPSAVTIKLMIIIASQWDVDSNLQGRIPSTLHLLLEALK